MNKLQILDAKLNLLNENIDDLRRVISGVPKCLTQQNIAMGVILNKMAEFATVIIILQEMFPDQLSSAAIVAKIQETRDAIKRYNENIDSCKTESQDSTPGDPVRDRPSELRLCDPESEGGVGGESGESDSGDPVVGYCPN